jgi:8-oxo-dGTP diphosphatase
MIHIYKFGLAVIKDGALLLCRPHAFPDLIVPGGTKEGNEDYLTNLSREVREELGNDACLHHSSLRYLGNFSDRAAGRTERTVEIELYLGEVSGNLVASSEIAELVWYQSSMTSYKLSDVVANKIMPFLIEGGLLHA